MSSSKHSFHCTQRWRLKRVCVVARVMVYSTTEFDTHFSTLTECCSFFTGFYLDFARINMEIQYWIGFISQMYFTYKGKKVPWSISNHQNKGLYWMAVSIMIFRCGLGPLTLTPYTHAITQIASHLAHLYH